MQLKKRLKTLKDKSGVTDPAKIKLLVDTVLSKEKADFVVTNADLTLKTMSFHSYTFSSYL